MEQLISEFKDKLANFQSDDQKRIVKEYHQLKEDVQNLHNNLDKLIKDNKSLQNTIDKQSRIIKEVENDVSNENKHVYVLIYSIIDPYFDKYDQVCGVYDHNFLVCDRDDSNFWEVKKIKMNEYFEEPSVKGSVELDIVEVSNKFNFFEDSLNHMFYIKCKMNNNKLTINEPSRMNGILYYLYSIGRKYDRESPDNFFQPLN